MTEPSPTPDERDGIQARLKTILKESKEALGKREDEKFGWAETGLFTLIGAAALGLGGLVAGAIAGWFVLPAVAAWAGAAIATSATIGTTFAAGSFLGLSAAGWAGAVGGMVLGALASLVPMSRRTEKKTEYKVQSIITPDIEDKIATDEFGRMSVDPRNLPHLKVTETLTSKAYRLGNLSEDTMGVVTGLAGAFAGAALGLSVAGIVKLAETRQGIYNYGDTPSDRNRPPPPPLA